MTTISLISGEKVLIDCADLKKVSGFRWYLSSGRVRYAMARIGAQTIYMHRLIAGTPEGLYTDHINGDGLDNRRENLRSCSSSQNQANIGKKSEYRLYKGVHMTRSGKFVARIGIAWKQKHLGTFETAELASEAYNEAALKTFGQFSRLNA